MSSHTNQKSINERFSLILDNSFSGIGGHILDFLKFGEIYEDVFGNKAEGWTFDEELSEQKLIVANAEKELIFHFYLEEIPVIGYRIKKFEIQIGSDIEDFSTQEDLDRIFGPILNGPDMSGIIAKNREMITQFRKWNKSQIPASIFERIEGRYRDITRNIEDLELF